MEPTSSYTFAALYLAARLAILGVILGVVPAWLMRQTRTRRTFAANRAST